MAQKKFKQNFAVNFGGVDGLSSAIEDDAGKVNLADNFEFAPSNSIRGTPGYQHVALSAGMIAIFPYTYSRVTDQYDIKYQIASGTYPTQVGDTGSTRTAADGATIQKLIGINSQAWSLENLTIPVTRVSGTYPFTWYNAPESNAFKFKLFANGTQLLDQNVGMHLSPTTIYSLLGAIDGLAQLSINRFDRSVCPPCAIVNATGPTAFVASTDLGNTYTVTVQNSPHTFKVGDVITFPKYGQLIGGIVLAITATTITYLGRQVNVVTGDVLGYLGQDASAFPVQDTSIASSGTLNIIFPYWKAILEGDSSRIIAGSATSDYGAAYFWNQLLYASKSLGSFYAPMTSVNAQGCLYVAGSASILPLKTEGDQGSFAGQLTKIDGQQVTRASMRDPTVAITPVGAGVLTGTYRYRVFLRRVDAQGNILDGSAVGPQSTTLAAQNASLLIGCGTYADSSGFLTRSCYKAIGNESTGGFFYVDDSAGGPPPIQVGDPAVFLDSGGVLRRQVVTDYCQTAATISPAGVSIKVSGDPVTINNNAIISAGLTVVVLRTLAGGNQFYQIHEAPISGLGAGTYTFVDNLTDATVLANSPAYFLPPIGKERNASPACSLVCQHQGGLVVARGTANPNTVSFSAVENIEVFPLASNNFDIPSTQDGYITAIASDTNDRLAVFKRRGYYDVVGDLDGGNFSINVKNEGDYGIASQASLVRVKDSLIGLSDNGFVAIRDGELSANIFDDVNANLVNRPNSPFEWAVAVNDAYGRRYSCSILSSLTRAETIHYALDYSRGKIVPFSRRLNDNTDAAGGMAFIGKDLYHLSLVSQGVFKRLTPFTPTTTTGYPARTVGDFYYRDAFAGIFSLESNVINLGEPDVLNTPIRLRIWSIPNEYGMDGWVPFTMTLYARAGFNGFGNIGIPSGADTTTTITFTQPGFVDVKLSQNKKTHFYVVRFEGRLEKQAPFITGYELLYAENYKAEDLVK